MRKYILCISLFLMLAPISALAKDAREIMTKMDDATNHSYASSARRVKFSTCRYHLKSGKMRCSEKPRVLIFESFHKGYYSEGFRDKDNKAVDVILEPVADKGTTMLSYAYADDMKDSDFWIYLPALGKVKRIVSVSDGNESGAVFGSEVSAEDADVKKLKDYTYKYLGDDVYRGREVYKIEMLPTDYRKTKSYYSKIIAWVDKERFLTLKEDLYDRQGRHYKQMSTMGVEKVDGVWMVTKASMNNLSKKRITLWEFVGIGLNMDIDDEFLTQRPLTDFAYRERQMSKYREFININQ